MRKNTARLAEGTQPRRAVPHAATSVGPWRCDAMCRRIGRCTEILVVAASPPTAATARDRRAARRNTRTSQCGVGLPARSPRQLRIRRRQPSATTARGFTSRPHAERKSSGGWRDCLDPRHRAVRRSADQHDLPRTGRALPPRGQVGRFPSGRSGDKSTDPA
jgi:hypothetical protein